MNYSKLNNDITEAVAEALQHFDHLNQKGQPQTFEETKASFDGSVQRYRNDPYFRAKVQMLVAGIMTVVQDNMTHNAANSGA